MRSELMTLRVEDRANRDLQKEKLIRHVKDENYLDDELETPITPNIKKVKKIVN